MFEQNFKTSAESNPQYTIGGGVSPSYLIPICKFLSNSHFRTTNMDLGVGYVTFSILVNQETNKRYLSSVMFQRNLGKYPFMNRINKSGILLGHSHGYFGQTVLPNRT